MRRLNRILTALAVAMMIVTIWLLGWLRQRTEAELQASVRSAVASVDPSRILHGPGGDALVHFTAAESIVRAIEATPTIREAVLAVVRRGPAGERELPIVPFTLGIHESKGWAEQRLDAGWQRFALGDAAKPFGYLYLDLDRSVLQSMNWAIGAIIIATALVLVTLIVRLWNQETSLTRTTIELNERRRELIRLERLALAGQLAAGLLHDLRKPVLHVQHSLDDLNDALGDFAPAAAPLQELRRQTKLFFQMLSESQFERFVQSDRATEEYVEVIPVLEQALALVKYERHGVEVLIRDTEALPAVLAHPFRLVQLFSNLILNSYQALAGRGRLIIEAQVKDGGVLVHFTDDGPGISPEVLPHIFEPFYTTKPIGEGTGLGLAICRLIAEDLGGRIEVESKPGGPTVFRVWLLAAQ